MFSARKYWIIFVLYLLFLLFLICSPVFSVFASTFATPFLQNRKTLKWNTLPQLIFQPFRFHFQIYGKASFCHNSLPYLCDLLSNPNGLHIWKAKIYRTIYTATFLLLIFLFFSLIFPPRFYGKNVSKGTKNVKESKWMGSV